jgi:NAD(P)H-dependent FMN reductase
MGSSKVLVVWCSTTGAAKQLAHAVGQGVQASGSALMLIHADEASPQQVIQASGLLWVCPEHLGSMAGAMKGFFDRCYYPLLGAIEGRAFRSIVSAGSDGQPTARQLQRICTGWRLREVANPWVVITGAQTTEAILAPKQVPGDVLLQARDLGLEFGEALALGIY